MKTAFQIFRRDVRRLLKNRAATLVMIGVCPAVFVCMV